MKTKHYDSFCKQIETKIAALLQVIENVQPYEKADMNELTMTKSEIMVRCAELKTIVCKQMGNYIAD